MIDPDDVRLVVGDPLPPYELVLRDPEAFRDVFFPGRMHSSKKGGSVYPPILPAIASRNRVHAVLWCRYCDDEHAHGLETSGGRVCHCFVSDSPYRDCGYLFVLCSGRLEQLKPPRAERRKPRLEPFGQLIHGWSLEEVIS